MKITIDLDEEEIRDAVFQVVVGQLVKKVLESRYGEGYNFTKDLRAATRAMIKENEAEIVDRSISAAADHIAKKGLKQIVERITED